MKILQKEIIGQLTGLDVIEINAIFEKDVLEFVSDTFRDHKSEFIKIYKPEYIMPLARGRNVYVSEDEVHRYYIDYVDKDYIYVSHRWRDYVSEKEEEYNNYLALTETEKKARLTEKIIRASKIEDENFIHSIVDNIDLSIMDIEVEFITDYEEFAKRMTLVDYTRKHSWAGEEGKLQEDTILYGDDLHCGFEYYYEYSNNGDTETPEEEECKPNFTLSNTYAVLIKEHYWDSYNTLSSIDETNYYLVIYSGEKNKAKVDTRLLELVEKYNLKGDS